MWLAWVVLLLQPGGTAPRVFGDGISWVAVRGEHSLLISKTEVTNAQYNRCVLAGACTPPSYSGGCLKAALGLPPHVGRFEATRHPDDREVAAVQESVAEPVAEIFQHPDHPVVCVSWSQAGTYARWVGGRLPSWIEWNKAVGVHRFPWGDTPPSCDLAALKADLIHASCGLLSTQSSCSRPQGNTPEGICDLLGNVAEWLTDTGTHDEGTKMQQFLRQTAGGHWAWPADRIVEDFRIPWLEPFGDLWLGIRVVKNGEPPADLGGHQGP